ncbi:type II toxin-antitoxin system HicB family antitoxin [Melioribacteraceae bacterium 4301-Me]|uniref:type II toxin-antitoxin system HicB family antitoxin n=1 Tax=Pyranulibacter aquaticus TaxID=3163344 RepID=UPI0035991415
MVLDLIITKNVDGYSAEVPSLKGCESWAHNEDVLIEKILELVRFYLKLPNNKKIIIDKARKVGNITVYKLVFDKYDERI